MKALLVVLAAAVAVAVSSLAAPPPAAADVGWQEVICAQTCWGSVGEGWINPEDLPGLGGGVRGGDGGTCSLAEALDGCTPDDIHISPCAGAWCDGDEGDGGDSVVCDFYCLRFPSVPYNYVGGGDPWGDGSGGGADDPPFDCWLAWNDPSMYPDWPSGCRMLG